MDFGLFTTWMLLLDSRGVAVLMAYNPTCVILFCLKPLFFHSLKKELRFSDNAGAEDPVVYLHLTDNSEVGKFGKIVSFRHRERGPHHGTAPVVLPTPPGRSRVDLPPHACLVA
jgi:hypothetical protein